MQPDIRSCDVAREPQQIDCVGQADSSYFRNWVNRLNAIKVKVGMLRQGDGRRPHPSSVPNDYIWYETANYGVIMSPVENGHRRFVLKV